jgi:acyl-CoA thioesterase FadM
MTAWTRLIFQMLLGLFQKPVRLNETCSLTSHVWPTEADLRLLNNSKYLSIMEAAQWNFGIRSGLVRLLYRNSWKPFAAATLVRFKKPIRRFQKFTIHTSYPYYNGKWIYCLQTILTKDGIAAIGLNKSVYMAKGHQVVEPRLVFEALGLPILQPSKPDYIESWDQAEAGLVRAEGH